ncbi:MAG TPA: Nramp family divalent metal transporter [Patescibacteria group bacterium]|jgi:manganese transport protein|nr:Nramp family divalent metal transporter [Patescibacteria group bacterium]
MVRKARHVVGLLGPAFVAAIAYVDPGNFAANISAGAQYGYALLWVLVVANLMALLVQYLSAKVGIVTGKSLPQIIAERLGRKSRIAYWLQAELVAVATDLAEVIGGALALNILFGIPMLLGALITGAVSLGLLAIYSNRDTRLFERVIVGLLLIIPVGFFVGLFIAPPDPVGALGGLIPRLENTDMILLATAMLGATVMPHVVYLHSALSRDRHGKASSATQLKTLLRATKLDVGIAMLIAGSVNIAMLLLAASALKGIPEATSLQAIFGALESNVSALVAWLFGISLLASGFASTTVGAQAGAVIMHDMLERKISALLRRTITIIPAIIIIGLGLDATFALILSQVALSFGIPFALAPLIFVTRSERIMGESRNPSWLTWLLGAIVAIISVLNLALIFLSLQ